VVLSDSEEKEGPSAAELEQKYEPQEPSESDRLAAASLTQTRQKPAKRKRDAEESDSTAAAAAELDPITQTVTESKEDEQERAIQEQMEAERLESDENAAQARLVYQKRYSQSWKEFKEGDYVSVFLVKDLIGKLDQPTVPGIVTKAHHARSYEILTLHGLLKDRLDAQELGTLKRVPGELKDAYVWNVWKQPGYKALTLRDLSKLCCTGNLQCDCGKLARKSGRPWTCGKSCKCVKFGANCSSACHGALTCNHKVARATRSTVPA
jgi:hypothetical protein